MPRRYTVADGDCIASIAFDFGFFPDTLWADPGNAALRERRASPHLLVPGDVVTIPDLRVKEATCKTGRVHRFRRRGVPEKFRVVLRRFGAPRRGVPYRFIVDGVERAGASDEQGRVEEWIPPDAMRARFLVGSGEQAEEYRICFGSLQPIDTLEGVRGRLRGLGLLDDHDSAGAFHLALRTFQGGCGLTATGQLDEPTRAKLREVYGL